MCVGEPVFPQLVEGLRARALVRVGAHVEPRPQPRQRPRVQGCARVLGEAARDGAVGGPAQVAHKAAEEGEREQLRAGEAEEGGGVCVGQRGREDGPARRDEDVGEVAELLEEPHGGLRAQALDAYERRKHREENESQLDDGKDVAIAWTAGTYP
jgi:hypothetical protein